MSSEVLELAGRLSGGGEPFVLATVVWRRGPSSGRRGSKAIIRPDGGVSGWLGGACAEPTVVREALDALQDGEPRLLFLGPAEEFDGGSRPGIMRVPMACDSEGAMEVYLEPVLPAPQVIIIGRSPAVDALARLTQTVGWRVTVVDDGGSIEHHPGVDEVVTTIDLEPLGVTASSFVVVATQGHYDEDALQAALATDAGYVGLVASAKRAASVFEFLRDRGVSDEALARVHAPAGLDLGSVEHDEMAVSILAQLVAVKALGGMKPAVAVAEPTQAIDPVCGMSVDVATARYQTDYEGQTYYFCAAGCLKSFERAPQDFV